MEFVILFPLLMLVVLSSIELSVLTLRNSMLERALDLSLRDLRLGVDSTPTHDELKQDICDNASIIPDCMNIMQIQLQRVSTTTWAPLDPGAQCIDRTDSLDPVLDFNPGASNDLMLVRVCAIFDPIMPTGAMAQRLPLDTSNGYAIVASSAFVVEP